METTKYSSVFMNYHFEKSDFILNAIEIQKYLLSKFECL